jgi:hypothetical protein
MPAEPFGIATYTSDDGNDYNIRINSGHFTASSLTTGNPVNPPYPGTWRPRMVHGIDSTKLRKASLVVPSGIGLFTGSTNTFTLVEASGSTVFTVTGRTGEKRPRQAAPF